MRKTIFFRYFIRSVVLLTLSMFALSASFAVGASRILGAQQKSRMQRAAQQVRNYLVPRVNFMGYPEIGLEDLREVMPLMADIGELQIIICDAFGEVKLNSDPSRFVTQLPDSVEERPVQRLPEGVIGFIRTDGTLSEIPPSQMGRLVDDASMVLAAPLIVSLIRPSGAEDITAGYIFVSVGRGNIRLLMREFLRNWSLMCVAVVLLSGITAYFSASRQARPLRQLAACARGLTRGDFSARADAEQTRDGEIHDLVEAFNGMADALQRGEELRRGFIANVSHELKTPMTTVSGFIGGILDGTISEERRGDTLEIVRGEVMRLSRLVESMAGLTRLQTGQLELHPRPLDIAELSLRVLLGFEGRINEKGLTVNLNVPEPETFYVNADPDAITQVLTNLLDNAVKFSSPGGELSLTVRTFAGKARVSVSNTGPAIPPEDLPYVFDRFYKADRSRSSDRTGFGLGLFLVRSILRAHNEDVSVACSGGHTEFTFTLTECRHP